MSKKETFRPLSQVAQAIAHDKYHDERFKLIAKELWEDKFRGTNRLPPLLNGVESDGAYLADLMHASLKEIQAAIDCLKEDGKINFYDPLTHLPTVVENGSFVSEQQLKSLIVEHHEQNKERIKEKILDQKTPDDPSPNDLLLGGETTRSTVLTKKNVNGDGEIDWAECFMNVSIAALEKTFPCKMWAEYASHAKRNGLIHARASRGKYNLFIAAMWWLEHTKPIGYDLARIRRTLANNLKSEYSHLANRLIGELD